MFDGDTGLTIHPIEKKNSTRNIEFYQVLSEVGIGMLVCLLWVSTRLHMFELLVPPLDPNSTGLPHRCRDGPNSPGRDNFLP